MESVTETTELEKKVREVISDTPQYTRLLRVYSLFWRSTEVSIDGRLLETLPPEEVRTIAGVTRYSEKEYARIVNEWRLKFIGGYTTVPEICMGKYWHPPEGSRLYRVFQEAMSGVYQQDRVEYFLLDFGDTYHYLKLESGVKNTLKVITGTEEFCEVLKKILGELDWTYLPA